MRSERPSTTDRAIAGRLRGFSTDARVHFDGEDLHSLINGSAHPDSLDHGIMSIWSVNVLPKTNFDEGSGVFGFCRGSILRSDGCRSEKLAIGGRDTVRAHVDVGQTDDFTRHGIPLHDARRFPS